VEIDPDSRELLQRIYEADRAWARSGHDDRSFLLMHLGGMQRALDHPGWEDAWPIPTSRQIDDLEELSLLRVESHPPNNKNRTFELSGRGRSHARKAGSPSTTSDKQTARPAPNHDDVLHWLAAVDASIRESGLALSEAVTDYFGTDSLDVVCTYLLDLKEGGFVKFLDPMARLNGWDATVRIRKASEFAVTMSGHDRLRPAQVSPGPTLIFNGRVGQVAARDILNHFVVTSEIADGALQKLALRDDLDEETRAGARSLIDRARGNAFGLLIAAEQATGGAVAVDLVRHAARAAGVHI